MGEKKINVLVVDDSMVCREMIKQILESDPEINVIDHAVNGQEALSKTKELSPDLITMDIHMPKVDGIEATEMIMAAKPTPIFIVSSSVDEKKTSAAFEALKKGALDVIKKPEPVIWNNLAEIGDELIEKVKILSKIKVIKHIGGIKKAYPAKKIRVKKSAYQILAIGSSTGGPSALLKILGSLPGNFPLPIVVAQHITDGFIEGMIDWLRNYIHLPLKIAKNKESFSSGEIYISPTGKHLTVYFGGLIKLLEAEDKDLFRPSVNKLFESVAKIYGHRAIGVILTGMGSDGALGLKMIKEAGGLTLAQSEESCAVYGMPKAAIEVGAVENTSDINMIPEIIIEATSKIKND